MPDAEYHHVWRKGDIVIWDNRCSIIGQPATTRPRRPHPLARLDHDYGVEALEAAGSAMTITITPFAAGSAPTSPASTSANP